MNTVVRIQLRMKGPAKLVFAAHSHNVPVHLGQHLGSRLRFFYIRSADERHGNFPDSGKFLYCAEAAQLSSVGIAAHGNRKGSKIHMSVVGELVRQ